MVMRKGLDGNEELTQMYPEETICLDIDTKIHPTTFDQMGIINYIELGLKSSETELYYSIDEFNYVSASRFRKDHDYDNTFFEEQSKAEVRELIQNPIKSEKTKT